MTLYRTGKYIITGASSEAEAGRLRDEFLAVLHRHGIVSAADDVWFTVQNYVCMADMERSLNLSALAIGLGLEVTEYEPEQFPGLGTDLKIRRVYSWSLPLGRWCSLALKSSIRRKQPLQRSVIQSKRCSRTSDSLIRSCVNQRRLRIGTLVG